MKVRLAGPENAAAIAVIYNQGIEGRSATFETRPRTASEVAAWFNRRHPIVIVEDSTQIMGFAVTSS